MVNENLQDKVAEQSLANNKLQESLVESRRERQRLEAYAYARARNMVLGPKHWAGGGR